VNQLGLIDVVDALLGHLNLLPETRQSILVAIRHDRPVHVWITEADAATLLGVDRRYLGRWREQGLNHDGHPFPFTLAQISDNLLRYDRQSILDWLESRTTYPPNPTNPTT